MVKRSNISPNTMMVEMLDEILDEMLDRLTRALSDVFFKGLVEIFLALHSLSLV